jgi:hypothetical protein
LGVVESDKPGSDSRRPVICGDDERSTFCRSHTESAMGLLIRLRTEKEVLDGGRRALHVKKEQT